MKGRGHRAVDLEVFRALLAPPGQALLAEACESYDEASAVRLSARMRREYPAELVAAALTQAALRQRAVPKFGVDAARMYFTRDGLEQATPAAVAAHRARRIAAIRPDRVADLCCGIGGDLCALALADVDVVGVDKDPLTVEVARANLAARGLSVNASVDLDDAVEYDRSAGDLVVADPARRSARGRVFDPAGYSPPWSFVLDLLAGTACVKTAPGIPHGIVPPDVEAEWVSQRGEVKEAALWSGSLRSSGVRRRATVLAPGRPDGATLTDADDPGRADVREPRAYLYEPDGAVIRAGLVTAVAPLVDGVLLHPRIAYLTSDRLAPTPYAAAYRIHEVLPYDVKAIRRALRARDAGTVTVKKRGLDVDPDVLRRRLAGNGTVPFTVVLTRTPDRAVALLVEPVAAAGS